MSKTVVSIGADPELFAFIGDAAISVHDLLPGTKFHPMPVPRGAIQVDGVAAEFNIAPAESRKEFIKNIKHVRGIMERILTAKNKAITLVAVPTVHFSDEYFKALPKETLALGCEPDYNAYTGKPNPKPKTTKPMRTGSGHVHIGWSNCDPKSSDYVATVTGLVKELDFVLYSQSDRWDKDKERAELYGQPGAFRFKPYGLEYRVLSNKWLDNDKVMAFVHDAAKNVTTRYLKGERFAKYFDGQAEYETYLLSRNLPIIEEYMSNDSL